MAKIYIGTSGWSYPTGEGTWKGFFYPPGTRNELEYYSRFFNTVEINSSFYRPPNPAYVAKWVKQTPPDFLFAVKLWQKFTHPEMYRAAAGEAAAAAGRPRGPDVPVRHAPRCRAPACRREAGQAAARCTHRGCGLQLRRARATAPPPAPARRP